MARAFLVVMDSVGIGGAPDAARFFNGEVPDTGANTLAHIAQACAEGRAETGRSGSSVSGLKFNALKELRDRLVEQGFLERCGELLGLKEEA